MVKILIRCWFFFIKKTWSKRNLLSTSRHWEAYLVENCRMLMVTNSRDKKVLIGYITSIRKGIQHNPKSLIRGNADPISQRFHHPKHARLYLPNQSTMNQIFTECPSVLVQPSIFPPLVGRNWATLLRHAPIFYQSWNDGLIRLHTGYLSWIKPAAAFRGTSYVFNKRCARFHPTDRSELL